MAKITLGFPKKPKKIKVSVKKLKKELDSLCFSIALKKHPYCVTCKYKKNIINTQDLTPGHLITRGKKSVRWDTLNVFTQCKGCNYLHEFQPEHYYSWFINNFGNIVYDELYERSNRLMKINKSVLLDLKDRLQMELNIYDDNRRDNGDTEDDGGQTYRQHDQGGAG